MYGCALNAHNSSCTSPMHMRQKASRMHSYAQTLDLFPASERTREREFGVHMHRNGEIMGSGDSTAER